MSNTYKAFIENTQEPVTEVVWLTERTPPQGLNSSHFKNREGIRWALISPQEVPSTTEDEQLVSQPNELDTNGEEWVYKTQIYTVETSPAPVSVTRGQFLVELSKRGILAEVQGLVGTQSEEIQLWFNHARDFLKTNPTLIALNSFLNQPQDLEDFFKSASKNEP